MHLMGIHLANLLQSRQTYKWTDSQFVEGADVHLDTFKKGIIELHGDIVGMNPSDLVNLGFSIYDDTEVFPSGYFLLLIPIWVYDLIPDGTRIHNINGTSITKGEGNVDMDTRNGLLAYGFLCAETASIPVEEQTGEGYKFNPPNESPTEEVPNLELEKMTMKQLKIFAFAQGIKFTARAKAQAVEQIKAQLKERGIHVE